MFADDDAEFPQDDDHDFASSYFEGDHDNDDGENHDNIVGFSENHIDDDSGEDHDDDDDSGEDDEGADDQLPTHLWAQLLVEPFSTGRRNNGKQGKQQIPGNITNSPAGTISDYFDKGFLQEWDMGLRFCLLV